MWLDIVMSESGNWTKSTGEPQLPSRIIDMSIQNHWFDPDNLVENGTGKAKS